MGSVGDSYDNALAETVISLYKTELIHRESPWRNAEQVEFATLEWEKTVSGETGVIHLGFSL